MKRNSSICTVILTIAYSVLPIVAIAQTASPHFRITDENISTGALSGATKTFTITGSAQSHTQASRAQNFRIKNTNARELPVPSAPRLTNDAHYYNKLALTLTDENYPDDILFAVAVSSDNWATQHFIQSDGTLGEKTATLTIEDFHTRAFWGNSDGMFILGLDPHTSYSARVAAFRPGMVQTTFSAPSQTVRTDVPFVRLSVAQNISDFFILNTNTVARATQTVLSVSTNNESGYQTYLHDDGDGFRGGLFDATTGALIPSSDAILAAGIPGYGAQASSPSAKIASRYDHADNTVGAITITDSPLSSNTVPVEEEETFLSLKVSIDGTTAAGHYTDTIYYTATAAL